MKRADATAAASVTRTISSASRLSIVARAVAVVAATGEDHRHVVAIGHLDRHLVARRAARLDDRSDTSLGGQLDRVGEREVGVRREDREFRTVGRLVQTYLDRRQPAFPG